MKNTKANMALLIARAQWTNKFAEAEIVARSAYAGMMQQLGASNMLTRFSEATLGLVLCAQADAHKIAEGRQLLQEAQAGVAVKPAAGKWVVDLFEAEFAEAEEQAEQEEEGHEI